MPQSVALIGADEASEVGDVFTIPATADAGDVTT